MPIGQSGGRSAGNRTSGPHRATQRERSYIDPPGHSEWVRTDEEEAVRAAAWRHDRIVDGLAMGIWVFASVIIAVLVCAWWGLL